MVAKFDELSYSYNTSFGFICNEAWHYLQSTVIFLFGAGIVSYLSAVVAQTDNHPFLFPLPVKQTTHFNVGSLGQSSPVNYGQ